MELACENSSFMGEGMADKEGTRKRERGENKCQETRMAETERAMEDREEELQRETEKT